MSSEFLSVKVTHFARRMSDGKNGRKVIQFSLHLLLCNRNILQHVEVVIRSARVMKKREREMQNLCVE